ncbi:MAG: alpha/beta fold hydrolase [Solirubrobacteraceae bacterium]
MKDPQHPGCKGSRRRVLTVLGLIGVTALLCAGCGGSNPTVSLLQRHMLSIADVPLGWKAVATSVNSGRVVDTPCFSQLGSHANGLTHTAQSFIEGSGSPSVAEVLAVGRDIGATWRRAGQMLAGCRAATLRVAGRKDATSIRPLSLPAIGSSSTSAYAWAFSMSGIKIEFDIVLFTAGRYGGELIYIDLGPPPLTAVTAFAKAAVAKARDGSTTRISGSVSVASAPVLTADTADGKVAYRILGAGPPLVLIMGYSGTMEVWDRRFVDALAQRYRVVIFDNAGIGRTQSLPAPLTIDAMADQTGALIQTLGLRRPDVLGWSMGSMIAQALAVLHPTQVRRLILCATYPGDGTTVRPSQQAIRALSSSNPQQVMADLFPADQTAATKSYQAALSAYPAASPAPPATITAQADAIKQWWNGTDPAGRHANTIAIPTLIADGTLDQLDLGGNSRTVARLIHQATLKLYPDAGHAFLFQDQTSLIPLIESFLDGQPNRT